MIPDALEYWTLPTDAEEEHRLLRHLGPEPLSTE